MESWPIIFCFEKKIYFMLGLTPTPNGFVEPDLDIRKLFLWSYC